MFELYAKEKRSRSYQRKENQPPLAEINPAGRIGFNEKATQEFMGEFEEVALGYNPKGNEIALIDVKNIPAESSVISFKVKRIAKDEKRSIRAKAFFINKDINIPFALLTTPEFREDPQFGKMVVLPLATAVPANPEDVEEAERLVAATQDSPEDANSSESSKKQTK